MILIIFIVNTSEFAYFFFKSEESHEGRACEMLCHPLNIISKQYFLPLVCYSIPWFP